jgi:hypothetical protein
VVIKIRNLARPAKLLYFTAYTMMDNLDEEIERILALLEE